MHLVIVTFQMFHNDWGTMLSDLVSIGACLNSSPRIIPMKNITWKLSGIYVTDRDFLDREQFPLVRWVRSFVRWSMPSNPEYVD